MPVPNRYHFIFGLTPDFGGKPFSLIHYLTIASCHAVNRPDSMTVYYAYEPSGVWWERARRYVQLEKVASPAEIYGNPVFHTPHKADVLRLQILRARGGIYLDLDVLCVRPFAPLREHQMVLGEEHGVGLSNAVILAQHNAGFLERWLDGYKTFSPEDWTGHSVKLPAALARALPSAIHALDDRRFCWPMYWRAHTLAFYLHPGSTFSADSYCVHLWESITWPHIGRLTPALVWAVESEFSSLARPYIDRAWCDDADPVAPACLASDNLDALRAAMVALPHDSREAFIVCDLQGIPRPEAAAFLKCTESDLDSRLMLARRLLPSVRSDTCASHAI